MENLLYVKRGYNTIEIYEDCAVLVILYNKEEIRYLIDHEDIDRVAEHKWYYHSNDTCSSSTKGLGILHNFIMDVKKGDNVNVIHKDGNGFNCCKENLEIVSKKSQRNVSPVFDSTKYIKKINNGYLVNLEIEDISCAEFHYTKDEAFTAFLNKLNELRKSDLVRFLELSE